MEKIDLDAKGGFPMQITNGFKLGMVKMVSLLGVQGIASVIKEVSSSLDAMQKTVANVEKGSKRIDALEGKVEQMFRLQHLTMAVLLQMAENQLGATSQQILEGAAGDYGPAEAVISKMIAGK